MPKQFHAFYINPIGNHSVYLGTDDEDKIFDLVKQSNDEYGNVRGLRVIYGELLEFEPATVVETYKIRT